jgi:hypothetical protein
MHARTHARARAHTYTLTHTHTHTQGYWKTPIIIIIIMLVTDQFGFRFKLSTEAYFHSLISEILIALTNKNLIGVFFVTSLRLLTVLITVSCCQN